MALDFQLNYMILKNIADWPNNYQTITKKEIDRILKKERQQRQHTAFINELEKSGD